MTKATSARLDRLLANMGYGSRREIAALAGAGLIRLDGALLRDAEQRITVTPDLSVRMCVRGEPLDPPKPLTILLHKPLGVTCSHKEAGPLIYGLLPERWRRRDPVLSTVGRLDRETTGLLLLTDDGALLHKIIAPKSKVSKRYQVKLDRPMRGNEADLFLSGTLMLDGEDRPLLPALLEVEDPTHAALTIYEGRYHQVRRMFAAVGNHVLDLHRDRVGSLELPPTLLPGKFIVLDADSISSIFPVANEI